MVGGLTMHGKFDGQRNSRAAGGQVEANFWMARAGGTAGVAMDPAGTRHARLVLAMATRQVLANGLDLLGVSAPEVM